MAAHRRVEIRNLTVQRLIAAATDAGAQVYAGRFQPPHEEELENGGVLVVYTLEEMASEYPPSNSRAGLRRDLEILVEAFLPAFVDDAGFSGDALAQSDRIAAQVEDALETWDPPGFDSSVLRLKSSKPAVDELAGGMPVARATMAYTFTYTTPYRDCSDPMVDNDSENILLRGLYPGGQVVEGCPASNTGEACPIAPPEGNAEGVLDHLSQPAIFPREPGWLDQ